MGVGCLVFPRILICALIVLQYGCTVCTAQHGIACHVSSPSAFHAASITDVLLSVA